MSIPSKNQRCVTWQHLHTSTCWQAGYRAGQAAEPLEAADAVVQAALARATAPVADREDGWETTAAVLAHEVRRLRGDL